MVIVLGSLVVLTVKSFQQPCEVGMVILPTILMRKLRHQKVRFLAQG